MKDFEKDIKEMQEMTPEEFLNHGVQEDGSYVLDDSWAIPDFSKYVPKKEKNKKG